MAYCCDLSSTLSVILFPKLNTINSPAYKYSLFPLDIPPKKSYHKSYSPLKPNKNQQNMPKTIHKKFQNPAIKHWCQKHQLNFCILFGSSVNGPVHAHSDIDIAIESSLDLAPQKLVSIGELQDILDGEIDLVIFHKPPLLLFEIMVKGAPLFIAKKRYLS